MKARLEGRWRGSFERFEAVRLWHPELHPTAGCDDAWNPTAAGGGGGVRLLSGRGRLCRNTVLPSLALPSWGLRPHLLLSPGIDFAFRVVIVIITHLNNFIGGKKKEPNDHQTLTVHSKFPAHTCQYIVT